MSTHTDTQHTHTHCTQHMHLHPNTQVFSMPLFEAWEVLIINKGWRITRTPWLMRVLFRSIYVICTTLIAATFPFFEGTWVGWVDGHSVWGVDAHFPNRPMYCLYCTTLTVPPIFVYTSHTN